MKNFEQARFDHETTSKFEDGETEKAISRAVETAERTQDEMIDVFEDLIAEEKARFDQFKDEITPEERETFEEANKVMQEMLADIKQDRNGFWGKVANLKTKLFEYVTSLSKRK